MTTQMKIISNELKGCCMPKNTVARTGNNSDQLPAGSKYMTTFLMLSKKTRPFLTPTRENERRRMREVETEHTREKGEKKKI